MIPVEVTQTPWHYTTFWNWLDHWQTLIAGGLRSQRASALS